MHCIFVDEEHHPMVVELNFPKFMALKQECKTGGLVIQRHYEIKFELQELAAGALIPSVVRDDPQIYPGRSSNVEETEGMSTPAEERGDLLVRFLWKHQTDCILDVRTTAQSNIHRKLEAVFLSHEREKKKSYFQACLYQRLLLSLCGFM